ncbi:MAG: hypothetical protein EOP83_21765 [Verrucomicrobiaceae bacterium]|nr:MAG: hypothetical protein EOP83_21765 [Verrucomicrobiaceae bacterium]
MACTALFDGPVSDEVIDKVRQRLGVATVTLGTWDAVAAVKWLRSDEAEGQFVIGNRTWVFTHAPTAFAFKMRFG